MKTLPRRASGVYWTRLIGRPEDPPPPLPAAPRLSFRTTERDGATVLELAGRLEESLDGALRHALLLEGRARVVVDAAGLEYLNSRGVSVFIAVVDELRRRGGDLIFARLARQGALVFDRLGLARLVRCFDTVEEAVEAFGTPGGDRLPDAPPETFVAGEGAAVFHAPGCASARRLRRRAGLFPTRRAAEAAGLRSCRRCLGAP